MPYLNDITSFQSFNETHFAQETIEDVNYGQIKKLWRLLMEVCLMFREQKSSFLKSDL
jgi:hypothetical protein